MNFRPRRGAEPDINVIPFIDVLLVVLIFLLMTTTYSKFTELQLTLPHARADAQRDRPSEIVITISADGRYAVNATVLDETDPDSIASAVKALANQARDNPVIISADQATPHQAVVAAIDAARRAGLVRLTIATQSRSGD